MAKRPSEGGDPGLWRRPVALQLLLAHAHAHACVRVYRISPHIAVTTPLVQERQESCTQTMPVRAHAHMHVSSPENRHPPEIASEGVPIVVGGRQPQTHRGAAEVVEKSSRGAS